MTKTVIELARQAGNDDIFDAMQVDFLERFADIVRADEREQCAKVCDDFERAKWESVQNIAKNGGRLAFAGPMQCAAAIRARNTQ